jgi:3,4-dihydroxy 2-butanone 4-phosphate synthase / GTP cyclohydrolase II
VSGVKVQEALTALARGGMVVVADRRDREDEGDLIMDAAAVTVADMAFFIRFGSGLVCTPMTRRRADVLGLPLMVETNTEGHGTAFTVTVDHVSTGTGISPADRAATVRALADPRTRPEDLRRPGHVFPLRSDPGGVVVRPGHTEAATDLLSLAGAGEVAVITELIDLDAVPLSGHRIATFAAAHHLPFLHVDDVRDAVLAQRPAVV